jgi:hypothetical protein
VVVVVANVVVVTMNVVDVGCVVGAVEVDGANGDVVVGSMPRLEHPANSISVTTRSARRICATLTPAGANQEVA